jgi:hypothetical protein
VDFIENKRILPPYSSVRFFTFPRTPPMAVILSARSGVRFCGELGGLYFHPAVVVFGQVVPEGAADVLAHPLGLGGGL